MYIFFPFGNLLSLFLAVRGEGEKSLRLKYEPDDNWNFVAGKFREYVQRHVRAGDKKTRKDRRLARRAPEFLRRILALPVVAILSSLFTRAARALLHLVDSSFSDLGTLHTFVHLF